VAERAGAHDAIAVTGANGFVGGAILARLAGSGYDVTALAGPHGRAPRALANVRWMQGNLLQRGCVEELVGGVKAIVHAAGPPSVAASWGAPSAFVRDHVEATAMLLECAVRAGVQHVVHISSAEIYGDGGAEAVCERRPPAPRSPYGACKLAAEGLITAFARAGKLDATILRLFSVYGPGQSEAGLIGTIARQLRQGSPLKLRDLRPVRDYVFTEDVADAVVRALRVRPNGAVLNVASGEGISVGKLASLAMAVAGIPGSPEQSGEARRAGDVDRLVADTREAERILGWRAHTPLREGLGRTLGQRTSAEQQT